MFITICTLLFVWLFLNTSPLIAQRVERENINDTGKFSLSDRELLFDYLQEWIAANEWMINYHGEFSGPIHSPQANLPWHRAHLREIESFLLKKPGGDAFVPLPKWRPDSYNSYTIVEPFTNFYNDSEDALDATGGNPRPNYMIDDFDNFICDQGSTTIQFAFNWNTYYHAPGHGIVDGNFNNDFLNTGYPLFWLFHADMDDAWYRWERDCSHAYDVSPADPNNPVIPISTHTVWDEPMMVKGIIEIENNATLYIDSDAVVQFRSTDYEAYPTTLVVKNGGTLHIDGAFLKGINRAVSSGNSGLRYYTNWSGIEVHHGGTLIIENGATIEQAEKAVHIGGTSNNIVIKNSTFKNNRRSIVAQNKVNKLEISGCDFINDDYLRDIIWGTTINAAVPIDLEVHFDHCVTHSTENHIELINCRDVIVESCDFIQTYIDPHLNNISTGIFSSDSHLQVYGSLFDNLWHGMIVYNSGGGPRGRVKVSQNCSFVNNKFGIHGINSDMMMVENSSFTMLDPAESIIDEDQGDFDCPDHGGHEHLSHPSVYSVGIRMSSGSSAYIIRNNTFYGPKDEFATMAVKSGPSRSRHIQIVHGNEFNGISNSIQISGSHNYYQMPCNDFIYAPPPFTTGLNTHMGVEVDGSIPHQGSVYQPTANILGIACNVFQQFYHANLSEVINYHYFDNSDQVLLCNTTNVSPENNEEELFTRMEYCDRITHCYQIPWIDCIHTLVMQIEERRIELFGDSNLTNEEKENEANLLETDMRRIVYEGIHMILDSSVFTDLGILLDSIALVIPEFELDRDIYYARLDTSESIRLLPLFKDDIPDASCFECDVQRLDGIIEMEDRIPAQEVVFLEVPKLAKDSDWSEMEHQSKEVNSIWPNPASETFFVKIDDQTHSIGISSIGGNILYLQDHLGFGIFEININHLPAGIYIVNFHRKNGETSHKKLIVK